VWTTDTLLSKPCGQPPLNFPDKGNIFAMILMRFIKHCSCPQGGTIHIDAKASTDGLQLDYPLPFGCDYDHRRPAAARNVNQNSVQRRTWFTFGRDYDLRQLPPLEM